MDNNVTTVTLTIEPIKGKKISKEILSTIHTLKNKLTLKGVNVTLSSKNSNSDKALRPEGWDYWPM